MAFCSNCGHQLADGAKFCFECGAKVVEPSALQAEQRKTVYDGEIHKCPNCGELLASFAANCPTCGHELRGTKASSAVSEFAAKIDDIERLRPTQNGIWTKITSQTGVSDTDQKKIAHIRNFAIPNNKEDLIEFIVLASSNVNLQRYNDFDSISESEQAVSDAWEAKLEQAYQKAMITYGHLPEFERIQRIYDAKSQQIHNAKKKRTLFWIVCIAAMLLVGIGSTLLTLHIT